MFYAMLVGTDRAYDVADAKGVVGIPRPRAALHAGAAREAPRARVHPPENAADRAYNTSRFLGLDSSALEALGCRALVDLDTGIDQMLWSFEVA